MSPSSSVAVIVRASDVKAATGAVTAMGGEVGIPLSIINGFAAEIPAARLGALANHDAVVGVTADHSLDLASIDDESMSDSVSMHRVTNLVNAREVWKTGATGKGVDVALIDSGIAPVQGLNTSDKVVNGLDISFDSQDENLRHLDLFGHGTHMAGIIAGRDEAGWRDLKSKKTYEGVAPDARVLNVKVANAIGATDVSQVIAALDWIVQHRNDNGMNIRVINLSFGTDSTQDYRLDPLAYATEVAWRHGIVVVAAAGNQGSAGLTNPSINPYIVSVGGMDYRGTTSNSDDVVPSWSGRGTSARSPDLVAPATSIEGLRAPGSFIDSTFPEARVGSRYFRGTGTSQATALVSGAAALLLQQRPNLSPDQVKALLKAGATPLPNEPATVQGSGMLNVKASAALTPTSVKQDFGISSGTGTLEGARGTSHVVDQNGNQLTGEQDIFGNAWDGSSWATASRQGTSWSGGQWNGTSWSGACWCGTSWSGTSWSGTSWSGTSWSGTSWSGTSWSGAQWNGTSWSGTSWSGTSWSGTSWSGSGWYGTSWSGTSWSGTSWSGTSWSGTSWSSRGWE